MASREGEGAALGGGAEGGAAPKRSSYEGAGGAVAAVAAADADADLELDQADPEDAAARAADMGAAFPCGRSPKSRARRPWKSSMATATTHRSPDLTHELTPRPHHLLLPPRRLRASTRGGVWIWGKGRGGGSGTATRRLPIWGMRGSAPRRRRRWPGSRRRRRRDRRRERERR